MPAGQLRDLAYKNEERLLLDRLDKHDSAKAAGENKQVGRLAAGFVVTVVVNASVGYMSRASMIWQLLWSAGLSDRLQCRFPLIALR